MTTETMLHLSYDPKSIPSPCSTDIAVLQRRLLTHVKVARIVMTCDAHVRRRHSSRSSRSIRARNSTIKAGGKREKEKENTSAMRGGDTDPNRPLDGGEEAM